MDPDKTHHGSPRPSDESAHESVRRRSNFSLSFALRSSRNRASVLSIDTPEPTCQERIHYPVFNPQDPRHNPSAGRRYNSQTSSSDSQKQAHWVQDLQKRSIYKVRSGILALREGLLRLSSWNDSEIDDTGYVLERAQSHENGKKPVYGLSGISDASTQEDVSFGVGMYRTNSPWPTASCEPSPNRSTRITSSLALTNVSTPEVRVSSVHSHRPESALFRHVNVSSDEPPPYSASFDGPVAEHLADTDTEPSFGEHVTENLDQSDASDWETIASGEEEESTSSMSEDVSDVSGSCDNDNTPADQPQPTQGIFLDIPAPPEWASHSSGLLRKESTSSVNEDVSGASGEKVDCSLHERETTNSSTGSFKLPCPDAPSTDGPSKSDHPLANIRESEALVTQERLQIHREIESVGATISSSSISTSRKGSANVKIAFPGLYQALLQQWMRKAHNNLIVNSAEIENSPLPSQASAITAVSEEPQPHHLNYHELPWSCESHTRRLAINTSGGQRTEGSSEVLSSGEYSSTSNEDIWVQAGHASGSRTARTARTANSSCSSPTAHAHPPTEMPPPQTRHSFGLHVAQRNDTGTRTMSTEQGQQVLPQQSFNQQTPADNQYASLSSIVTGGPLGSPFDQSECSSIWTNASSVSPGATSRTSMSNTPWSPIDSPIDEEVLFSNSIWRDEYYMADGKTSSLYPDGGDQPVKRIWRKRVVDDGSIHSGPGLDRTPSSRLHVSELMTPMTLPRRSQPDRPRLEMEGLELPEDHTPGHQTQARRLE